MTQYRIVVTPGARAAVTETARYIDEHTSPEAALRWLDGLERMLKSLADRPEQYPVAREDPRFKRGTLRRALYHSHRILFTITRDEVRILYIRHGARDELDAV